MADRLYEEAGAEHHRHYDFVLGVPGAMPPWDDSIEFLAGHVADGATWSATGIGKGHLPVTERMQPRREGDRALGRQSN